MLLHHSDAPLPWKQSKMAAKQLFKNHSMQIFKKFTVSTNIKLSSFLRSILWLLCFSFTLLYYFSFYACKNDTNDISNRHNIVLFAFYACKNYTNDISNRHKTKTNIPVNTQTLRKLSRLHLYSRLILWVLKLRKMCKSENIRKHTRNETKASHLI